jgi:hypothetical protein
VEQRPGLGLRCAYFSQLLVRKDSELPFLITRLICHIDCAKLAGLREVTDPEAREALGLPTSGFNKVVDQLIDTTLFAR